MLCFGSVKQEKYSQDTPTKWMFLENEVNLNFVCNDFI